MTLGVTPISLRRLPIEHAPVVTHLCWLRRYKIAPLFLSTQWNTEPGLVPRPKTPGFPSKIVRLPSNTNTTPTPVPR